MYVRRRGTLVEVDAPAKVNLFLEILSRRGDGFHELEMLVAPINRFDTLSVSPEPDGSIRVHCRWAHGLAAQETRSGNAEGRVWDSLPSNGDNLVCHALRLLQERCGSSSGARVELVKRVPAAAGLGGASSDAAAALVAANEAWKIGWSRAQLAEVAAQVGSDVPLFLHPGACVCRGRGELVFPLDACPTLHLVVVRPPEGLSTAAVYQRCRPATDARPVSELVQALARGHGAAIGRALFNRLQPAAEGMSVWVTRLSELFSRLDVWGHQMSGSGTTYFGICRHARHARRVAGQLQAIGVGAVFAAATINESV